MAHAGLKGSDLLRLVKATAVRWMEDRVPRLGASLAFYTVLSLAPMLVVVISIAGMAFGRSAAEGQLMWQIEDMVGPQAARAIQSVIRDAARPASGGIAATIGLLTLFFGATAAVNELRDAINTIWRAPVKDISGLRSILVEARNRLFSFAMILGVGFFLLVSLALNAWVAAAGSFVGERLPAPEWLLQLANSTVSFVVIALVFAVLYKALPAVPLEWGDVAVGALATSAMFTLGKFLIGVYLGKTSLATAYGAAGSLVVVLLWVYYSAQVFFLGAEFTYVYTCEYGSKFRRKLERAPAPVPESEPGSLADKKPDIVIVEPFQKG